MIEHLAFQKAALANWNKCKWAGDFVTLTVVDAEKGISTQSGYCTLRLEKVQMRERCLWCNPPEEREKPHHEKTAIRTLRIKKGAERAKRRREERIRLNTKSKGIDEY